MDRRIDIVTSGFSIRSGMLMIPPTAWIHFENTTIEVAQLTWVCVSVRTRLMKKLKFGCSSACLLANKNNIWGYAWVRASFADCCGPSYSLDTFRSLLTKVGTETRTVFSASKRWKVQQEQDSCTSPCRIFADPSYWMDIKVSQLTWVRVCVHTRLTKKLKVRAD